MKLLKLALILFVISDQAMACSNADNSLELKTESTQLVKVFLSYDELAISVPLSMKIEFCNEKQSVLSNVTFDATMPAHQHGMNYNVEVNVQADNIYQVKNVVFHMPGVWRIQINAETQTGKINYSTDIVVN